MEKQKIFQFNKELYKVTGIQKVLLDIHDALKEDFECKIVGNIPYNKLNPNLNILKKDYIKYTNPLIFKDSIVIIHERRLMPLMWILTHIPGLKVKCIYIHHNQLFGNKILSLFPQKIIAISDQGIKNLTEYFGVKRDNIVKIPNCVREIKPITKYIKEWNCDEITILYPARINSVKRQIEIVNYLKGRLDPRINILFAGDGPMYEELKRLCNGSINFKVLGFRNDIKKLMLNSDFVLLFSKHEGLPISLIESIHLGVPVICNNVGGNSEIIKDGRNGIIVNDWESLIGVLNSLPKISIDKIESMRLECRKIYLENFTFDKFKLKYINLIKSII